MGWVKLRLIEPLISLWGITTISCSKVKSRTALQLISITWIVSTDLNRRGAGHGVAIVSLVTGREVLSSRQLRSPGWAFSPRGIGSKW